MRVKFKKTICITLLFILLFPYVTSLAVSIEDARNAIASYAVNFQKKHGSETCWYNLGSPLFRNKAYLDKTKYDKNTYSESDGKNARYLIDCVGWINFCIHNATGLDCGINNSNVSTSMLCFSAPGNPGGQTDYFSRVSNENPEPGDLISNDHHIMVYVGDTEGDGERIVHSVGDGLSYQTLDSYKDGYDTVIRLNEIAVNDIKSLNTDGDPINTTSNSNKSTGVAGDNINMSDWYYNGAPDGKYSVTKSVFERIVDSISGIFDFLVGLNTLEIRMVFVGWTAIIENLVTFSIETIVGDDNIENIPVTSTEIDSSNNITIEKIVFNQIGIFDVNFFNYNDKDEGETEDESEAEAETETDDAE